MQLFLIFLSLLFGFWAAFQLQLVTFFPRMGLWTVHRFEAKRWGLRILSGAAMVAYFWHGAEVSGASISALIFWLFLMFMSFFNNNTAGFRALNPGDVIIGSGADLADETMVIGMELADAAICYPFESLVIPRHLITIWLARRHFWSPSVLLAAARWFMIQWSMTGG